MKKIEVLKTGVSLVVSIGVGAIVGNLVKSTTPVDVNKIMKGCIAVGSLVLTGVASDMAGKYTEEVIDDAVETANEIIYGKDKEAETEDEEET